MQKTTSVTVRINKELKERVQRLYSELGIDMTTAINVFFRQSLKFNGFPFDVNLEKPNRETRKAMIDANRDKNMSKSFTTIEDLKDSLNS